MMEKEPLCCRACLQVCDTFHAITEICKLLNESYQSLFERFSGYQVLDGEPHIFCMECSYLLVQVIQFQATVQQTQEMLEKVKDEDIVDDDEEVFDGGMQSEQETVAIGRILPVEEENVLEPKTEFVEEEEEEGGGGGGEEEMVEPEQYFADELIEEEFIIEEIIDEDGGVKVELIDHFGIENGIEVEEIQVDPPQNMESSPMCRYCDRRFASEEDRNEHEFRYCITRLQKEEIMTCQLCEKTGPSRLIRLHIANTHRKKPKGPFQCDICKKWLTSKPSLQNHFRCQHLDERHRCAHCDKSYSSRSGLNTHRQIHHKSLDSIVACNLCTNSNNTLLSSSSTEMPQFVPKTVQQSSKQVSTVYKCTKCIKAFSTIENLKRHQVIHTNVFSCSKCPKVFKDSVSLKKHAEDHIEFKYECPVCQEHYLTDRAMRNHVEFMHPGFVPPPSGTIVTSTPSGKRFSIDLV